MQAPFSFETYGDQNEASFDFSRSVVSTLAVLSLALLTTTASFSKPLKVGYSDWPGWVAWEIGIQKGWFKKAGVDVEFVWFEYVPSMDAFSAGKVDAVTITNGDALVTGSAGAPGVAIMMNDYSNGNDMVVAKPGIKSPKQLKGKKLELKSVLSAIFCY